MKVLDESGGAFRGSGKILKLVRAILALAIVLAPLAAVGQSLTDGERASLQAQKAALFQKTLSNPDNLDAAFAYADVAVRLGDYEAAVGTLERMLLFNPNLAQLQLDLGALYFRMGSYDLARAYLDKAAATNPSPEDRRAHRRISGARSMPLNRGIIFPDTCSAAANTNRMRISRRARR